MFRPNADPSSQSPVTMPDTILEASLRTNSLYPQTHTGLTIAIGAAAAQEVLNGELTWQQIIEAKHTPEQIDALKERVTAMHKAFNIPCKLLETDQRQVEHSISYFTPARLTSLTRHALSGAQSVNANFARATLPELADANPLPPVGLFGIKSEERVAAEIDMLDPLFVRSRWRNRPRPEAVALNGLWGAAAKSLESKPAREISKSYRPLLCQPAEGRPPHNERKARREVLNQAMLDLNNVLTHDISKRLPEIAKETGVTIAEQNTAAFVAGVSTGLSIPSWLRG
jgi:hypothetical protein